MPGYIDKRQHFTSASRAVCKAKINSETSSLFFFKTIGVGAGERFYKRCLSMINMTRGGYERHGGYSLLHKRECECNFFVVA